MGSGEPCGEKEYICIHRYRGPVMLYSLIIYVAWYTMDNSKTSCPGEIDMGTWLSQSLPQPKEVPTTCCSTGPAMVWIDHCALAI